MLGTIVFWGSVILVLYLILVLIEVMHCMVFFYCLHQKDKQLGKGQEAPQIIREL